MGWRKTVRLEHVLWFAAAMQLASATPPSNDTRTTVNPPTEVSETIESYSWSSWGSWSPCSKTCGGGVAIQDRQCLPRKESVASAANLSSPVVAVRVTRQAYLEDCPGVSRRYHECNTVPCPSGEEDGRAQQCAMYDRRPFRGRFYTWVPYIDGNLPCTLNCRPLGQQFYASLGLVDDGTPCTRPGYRAICVQGECKVVGRESILASTGNRELRCGRRLVSGLFSRPRLPLGYSYVTTVPRGACRLNVSEIVPSDNYIALKISNSSYIMNGEFAVSSPGVYEAVGSRFIYTRIAGLDSVFAMGPILHPVDIMVLYTQPSPSIKYEYFTESHSNDVDFAEAPEALPTPKHTRRHHSFDAYPRTSTGNQYPDFISGSKETGAEGEFEENVVGTRKFIWKISSYTQCTRSCGGGIQLGKYQCVEISNGLEKEVSPVHCPGSAPVGKRRRCNNLSCPPRWRAAAWSACPQCGPATRTRIVGCVQDHFRGITKVSDSKCPDPKPATSEICNVPECNGTDRVETRVVHTRDQTDAFRDGPVYTLSVDSFDRSAGPEYTFSNTVGWLYTEWSDCTGWCVGGGIQTRRVRCADPAGCTSKAPESSRACTPKLSCEPHEGRWFTGEWSACSSSCGGKQVRGVLCIGGSGRHLRDTACKGSKPEHERKCGNDCPPTWYTSDWDQCTGNCSTTGGVQRRSVVCMKADKGSEDSECQEVKPSSQMPCELQCPVLDAPSITRDSDKPIVVTTAQPATTTPKTPQAEQKAWCPRKGAELFTPEQLLILYQAQVRSCMEYCSHLWDGSAKYLLKSLESIERRAKKLIGNDKLFEARLQSLEHRRCEDKLTNCALAVQARLCHYNYYVQNCCGSCTGR